MEQYEIYNGRKPLREWEEIVFARYRHFLGTGYLFECAFFQNIIEDLILFHGLSDGKIVEFYRKLYGAIDQEAFLLLYLYSDKLEETVGAIKKERSDEEGSEVWYPMMSADLADSPYGKQHRFHTFEDLLAHFEHRQRLELRIIREVVGERALILPAKNWKMEEIAARIQ